MAKSQTSRQPRGRTVRRWALRAVVFLLLGAVVNVAVAWGLAFFANPFAGAEYRQANRYDVGVRSWSVYRYSRTGIVKIDSRYEESSDIRKYATADENVEALIPSWGRMGQPSTDFQYRDVIGYGWPCIALWAQLECRTSDSDSALRGGIRWSTDDWSGRNLDDWSWEVPHVDTLKVLPFFPAPFGFAINTFAYAATLWLLFAAPGTVRSWRRVRKGLCGKCAYPIGERDICTECGARLKSKSPKVHSEEPSP